MVVDRNDNSEASKRKAEASVPPPKPPVPSHPQETPWIMQSLNRIHVQIDSVAEDIAKLRDRITHVEEKINPIARIESRLQKLEHHFWIAIGILICLVFISRIFLLDFDVTITPKP